MSRRPLWATVVRLGAAAFAASAVQWSGSASAADSMFTGTITYDLSLLSAAPDTLVKGATGVAQQNVRQSCRTFTQTTDAGITMTSADGRTLNLIVRGEMIEDDTSLSFKWTTWVDGQVVESSSGIARREIDGLAIDLTLPLIKSLKLDGDIRFPMDVARAALDAAVAGKAEAHFLEFNGSGDGETPENVSATFGPPPASRLPEAGEQALVAAQGLTDKQHWWSRFASVPIGGLDEPSITEATLYANGIVLGGTYEVSGLRFNQTPATLTPIAATPCPG